MAWLTAVLFLLMTLRSLWKCQIWVDVWVWSRRQEAENVLNAAHNDYEPSLFPDCSLCLLMDSALLHSLNSQRGHRPWLNNPLISQRFGVKSSTKRTRGTRTLKIKHNVYFLAGWFDVCLNKACQSLQIFNQDESFSDHIFDQKKMTFVWLLGLDAVCVPIRSHRTLNLSNHVLINHLELSDEPLRVWIWLWMHLEMF